MPTALTTLNAATSDEGFAPEKIAEIKEKFKNGMMYGSFGAYASGPLGNALEKVVTKSPALMSTIVGKTMGAATETSADILFDRLTSDLSLKESLQENGFMNFGMMIVGGRLAKGADSQLKDMKIYKTEDGTFSVKDVKGKEVFKATDENALAGFVLSRGAESKVESLKPEIQEQKQNQNIFTAPKELTREEFQILLKDFSDELNENSTFPRADIAGVLSYTTKDNISFAKELCADKDLDKSRIQDCLKSLIIHDGVNNGNVDTNKVKRFSNLLQNQATAPFMVKLLNDGVDIDTAAFLSKTHTKITQSKQTDTQVASKNAKTAEMSVEQKDFYETLSSHGLNEKEAASIVKAASANGVIDSNIQGASMRLIQSGVAKNKIGDILNASKITGEFNPKIVDDYIAIQNTGLNPLLEKKLAVLNNIAGEDVAIKFNANVKKQIKGMLSGMSENTKLVLKDKGIDFDSISQKLESKIVKSTDSTPQKATVKSGLRSKQNIKGFERIIIDKYNPDEKVWRNETATKAWAQEKYDAIKSHDYDSRTYTQANEHRQKQLKEWFDFLDTESDLRDNVYAKIIVSDFVTKDLLPENADIPPQLDKELVKEILTTSVDNVQNVSFSKIYSERIREKAMSGNKNVEDVEVDGIKGKWYTVPQTDSSAASYKSNVDKVKAFSDGTNWCIRTYNAEPYVNQGAMHFFVDENGLTQICVRENSPGSVYEIQKRQQNSSVPIPYVNVIDDYLKRNGLEAQSRCQDNIDAAKKAKPAYDDLKKEFTALAAQQDYKSILEKMGITVTVKPDNTLELSHYSPKVDKFSLSELGIKENDLLSNVSSINGDATFKDSNATTLPLLEHVGGKFTFDESSLSDVRKLKDINGYKIEW